MIKTMKKSDQGGTIMKNLFLFPFRLAGALIKVSAVILALSLMVVLLMPALSAGNGRECETCPQLLEQINVLEQECAELRQTVNSEFYLRRRIDLQLFPGLGLTWLRIRTFDFWNCVGYSQYEAYPEGTAEVIWSSGLFECSLTTLERCYTQ